MRLAAYAPERETLVVVASAAVVALSAALLLVSDGGVALAFVPVAMAAGLWALLGVRTRTLLLVLLSVALVADIPSEVPFEGMWHSPFHTVGALMFDNLNNTLPIHALRFSGFDAFVVFLVVLAIVRISRGRIEDAGQRASANVILMAAAVSLVTVLLMEARGLGRGGDFKNSLWQVRPLLWLPVMVGLFTYALRGVRDVRVLGAIVVVAACIKTVLGLYFLFAIARPMGYVPDFLTSHHDSVVFVTAIVICVTALVHTPSRATVLLNLTATPWILIGIAANNRRLAYVSLVGSLFIVVVLLRGRLKRAIIRAAIAAAPLVALYIAAGTKLHGGIFKPAAMVLSVTQQKDASSLTRDIENYNVMATLRTQQLFGTGFGHEYLELVKAFDISRAFAQYRYLPHNSVLWMWSVGGLVGFAGLWLIHATGIFLAARAYRFARTGRERAAAVSSIAIVFTYLIQAWGDMGGQSWTAMLLCAAALAMAGQLAAATGGWPTRLRVFAVASGPRVRQVPLPRDGSIARAS